MSARSTSSEAVTGILNIDKPVGPTSHDVVRKLRWLLDTKRVGHAGTLDPLASGVLVIAAGRATRLLEYVVGQRKRYLAEIRLGQSSTTYDGEGEISAAQTVAVSVAEIEAALSTFRGTIQQIPPMHSAIKQDGRPLYELARKGQEVERAARTVTIYELEIVQWESPVLKLRIVCSAGTYIRSLAHDLGQVLGSGAYLSGLQRTAVGTFTIADAISPDALSRENVAGYVQPPDRAVAHLPRLDVSSEATIALANGRQISCEPGDPEADLARAYDPVGEFIGIVVSRKTQWKPHKIFYQT